MTYGVLHPGLPLSLRLSFFFFCKLLLLLPFVKQHLLPTSSPLHVSFLQSQLASIRLWPTIRFLYLLTTTTFDTTGKLYFTDIGREMVQKKIILITEAPFSHIKSIFLYSCVAFISYYSVSCHSLSHCSLVSPSLQLKKQGLWH